MTDLRFAFRQLAKSPGFAAVAVLTLALGLTVNITVFGMINEFLLRPLNVEDPQQLAFIMRRNPQLMDMPFMLSYPDYRDMRASIEGTRDDGSGADEIFADLLAYVPQVAHVSQGDRLVERAWVHEVSDNYFDVLGVQAAHGRVFLPGEGVNRGADPIAVLAHDYWVERFGANPGIIGQSIKINGEPFTIVGVTPEGFGGAEATTRAHLFVPAMMADQLRPHQWGAIEARGNSSHMVMARLQAGATMEQARAAAEVMLQRLIADHPNEHPAAHAVLIPELQSRPSPYVSKFTVPALGALMVLAVLVLIVAAANITNLLFARAADAERALAIRSSMGATRWRLIRQLLAESVLLAVAAAIVGWYASDFFGVAFEHISTSPENPPMANYGAGWRPFAFTLLAALVTGVATGLLPALRATRMNVLPLLKESTTTVTRTRHPLRSLLVIGQIAASCVVLVCAGVAVRSLHVLSNLNLGFRPDNVLLATFDLQMQRYDRAQTEQFQKALLDEVRRLPGVREASLARGVPFDRSSSLWGGIGAEGQPPPECVEMFSINCVPAAPRFLETMGIPIVAGRTITERDDENAPPVAVISRSVAQHFWPGEDPIGKRLTFRGQRLVEVVGLVDDVRYMMLTDRDRPLLFLPIAQEFTANNTLAIRTENEPLLLARSIERIVHRLDPGLPVHNIRTLEEQITQSPLGLMPLRIGVVVAALQGTLVLLLSIMGLYGLVSFAVTRRWREIGIRLALGATTRDVVTLVTRPSLVLTGIGLAIGLLVSVVAVQPLAMFLYGVSPNDLTVFGGVAALVIAVTVLATWWPARRATKVNPVEALRTE